jgi:hypothetical protein
MYEEDRFNPAIDDDHHSIDSNKKRKGIEFERTGDKNYFVQYLPVNKEWKNGRYYRTVKLELFGSGQTGTFIRNAVTGNPTNFRVGSKDESMFFKVNDVRGVNGSKNPIQLYYDSPEQYENHFFTELPNYIKEEWRNRNQYNLSNEEIMQ